MKTKKNKPLARDFNEKDWAILFPKPTFFLKNMKGTPLIELTNNNPIILEFHSKDKIHTTAGIPSSISNILRIGVDSSDTTHSIHIPY